MTLNRIEKNRINGVLRGLLHFSYKWTLQVLKFGAGETKEHMLQKAKVCYALNKLNYVFYTEAIFKNGKRADILTFSLGEPVAIEIIASEQEKSIEKKRLNYPCRIVTIPINTDFEEKMIL